MSPAFAHFFRGHLLATFARVLRRCPLLWDAIDSITFDDATLVLSLSETDCLIASSIASS